MSQMKGFFTSLAAGIGTTLLLSILLPKKADVREPESQLPPAKLTGRMGK